MGRFLLGLVSRTCVYTSNEHISIDMYDPQTHIQSCWLEITARADFDTLASPTYALLLARLSPGIWSRTCVFTLNEHISIGMQTLRSILRVAS
jgi:hypothetical protein